MEDKPSDTVGDGKDDSYQLMERERIASNVQEDLLTTFNRAVEHAGLSAEERQELLMVPAVERIDTGEYGSIYSVAFQMHGHRIRIKVDDYSRSPSLSAWIDGEETSKEEAQRLREKYFVAATYSARVQQSQQRANYWVTREREAWQRFGQEGKEEKNE